MGPLLLMGDPEGHGNPGNMGILPWADPTVTATSVNNHYEC